MLSLERKSDVLPASCNRINNLPRGRSNVTERTITRNLRWFRLEYVNKYDYFGRFGKQFSKDRKTRYALINLNIQGPSEFQR